jgi:hypothetical protein
MSFTKEPSPNIESNSFINQNFLLHENMGQERINSFDGWYQYMSLC